jgi:hypothetical protein
VIGSGLFYLHHDHVSAVVAGHRLLLLLLRRRRRRCVDAEYLAGWVAAVEQPEWESGDEGCGSAIKCGGRYWGSFIRHWEFLCLSHLMLCIFT